MFEETIQEWFAQTWGGSLLLPDGWYGRPHDNQHALTSLNENGDGITLVLDGNLTLHFERVTSVSAQGSVLVLGPFERLRFEWKEYGSGDTRGAKDYGPGVVKVIAAAAER